MMSASKNCPLNLLGSRLGLCGGAMLVVETKEVVQRRVSRTTVRKVGRSGEKASVKVEYLRLSQSHVLRESLSTREPGDRVRRARLGVRLPRGACRRGIYDNM